MTDDAKRPLVRQMACMTIAAADPAALVTTIRDIMGWTVATRGTITPQAAAAWGVAAAGLPFTLLCSPHADRGMIRIIPGANRFPTRQIGARWSGVEIVVSRDIDGVHARMIDDASVQRGLDPDNADFTDVGANIHRFFWVRPAGGTHFMFTAAVTEARDYEFPDADAQVGHIFSIPLVSTDFARSFAFYTDVLGLRAVLEDHLSGGIWHKSWSLEEGESVDLAILVGDAPGFGLGGIELQGYSADVVDPVAAVANRFDGGACMGTFIAPDFDAAVEAIRRSGVAHGEPCALTDAPYHGARSFAFIGPGGERLEIAEAFTPE